MAKTKTKKLTYVLLKNKECDTPWTSTLFYSEEGARKYFDETVERNKFGFDWNDFEVIPCEITYKI